MTTRPIPYPSDTRAKGWRFELDYEKIEQSDTWSLAAEVPMAQHSLLMMWMMAWTQVPCGSLPNDTDIIRAKCKIPPKMWTALKPVLMRGWWLAEDGRLYHDTIADRVQEMLDYRAKERNRKASSRARNTSGSPELSHGTNNGQTEESDGRDDTGTGTGSGIGIGKPTLVAKDKNIVCVNKAHTQISDEFKTHIRTTRPELNVDLVFANFTNHYPADKQTFAKWQQWVANERVGVAEAAHAAAQDPETRPNVERRGIAVGIGKWDDSREQWPQYKARVVAAERERVAA